MLVYLHGVVHNFREDGNQLGDVFRHLFVLVFLRCLKLLRSIRDELLQRRYLLPLGVYVALGRAPRFHVHYVFVDVLEEIFFAEVSLQYLVLRKRDFVDYIIEILLRCQKLYFLFKDFTYLDGQLV